jgi:hypothetical protein
MGWTLLHVNSNLSTYPWLLPSPAEPTPDAATERWCAVRAHAAPGGGFRRCCRGGGRYDDSNGDYYVRD